MHTCIERREEGGRIGRRREGGEELFEKSGGVSTEMASPWWKRGNHCKCNKCPGTTRGR
jgi:hypothetical protein